MLRRRGVNATLVIGYRSLPISCHAWVEHDGTVVWDSRSDLPSFHVLDRF